jgi:hypothetical protein
MAGGLTTLVERFALGVTDAILRGDARTGNKFAKQYIDAFDKLRVHGEPGRDALTTLFTHARPDVRVIAAAFLLRYRTTEAMAILREEASGRGLAALGATYSIKNWEDGTWSLDPEDTT